MNLVERVLDRLPLGTFLQQVGVLAGSTMVAQGLVALVSPVLTRLYTPEDFGVLAVFSAVVSVLNIVAALRYELAIPLPESEGIAGNLLGLSIMMVFSVTTLVALTTYAFGVEFALWANVEALVPYLWLVPLGVMGAGLYNTLSYWAIRERAFADIGRTKITRGVGLVAVQLGGGFLFAGPVGLLAGDTVGYGAGSGRLGFRTWLRNRSLLSQMTLRRFAIVARRYIRFPLYSSWSSAFNAVGAQLPMVLLAYFFGPAVTGAYALGYRVLYTPLSLVGQSIAQVFLSRAAEANRTGDIRRVSWTVFSRLVDIGIPAALIVGISAPEVFQVVFGNEWAQAGLFAQIISPWLFLVLVASPLSTLPSVFELQGKELIFQITLLATRLGSILTGGWMEDPILTIILFATSGALCWAGFMLWNMRESGVSASRVLFYIAHRVAVTLPIVAPVIVARIFTDSTITVLALTAVAGSVAAWQLIRSPEWREILS